MGLFFVFFISFFYIHPAISEVPNIREAANDPTWHSLLYLQQGKSDIEDHEFFIKGKFVNAEQELEDSIASLTSTNRSNLICKYPARYYWIQKKFKLNNLEFTHCEKLNEFITRAPADKIAVVFSSENISTPSSMMGHIYLKTSGQNPQNKIVEHAISFYTDADGINFPKIIFESIVTGKRGFYALSPDAPVKNKYLFSEQRNVWEFELDLSKDQKTLLQYHLFELKKIKLTYYFHTFNCATLIQQMLSIPYPKLNEDKKVWATPLDVVRMVHANKLVKEQSVYLASRWKIKSILLSSNIGSETISKIKKQNFSNLFKEKKVSLEEEFVILELTRAYNNYLLEEKQIDQKLYAKNQEDIAKNKNPKLENAVLDLQNFKSPAKTKSWAQAIISVENLDDKTNYKLKLLPASHLLEDDSSQYLNETELQISSLILGYSPHDNKLLLDEYMLYSATSLQPSDPLTGGLSGRFQLGYFRYRDLNLNLDREIIIDGSLGKTYRASTDFDIYFLAGSDFILDAEPHYRPQIELGFVFREVWNMKTIGNIKAITHSNENLKHHYQYHLRHFIELNSFSLVIEGNFHQIDEKSVLETTAGLKKYF